MGRGGEATIALACAALCACTGAADDIRGDDSAFLPGVRVALPIGDSEGAFELDAGFASGGFHQTLGPGDGVELDHELFTGPGQVAIDFEMQRYVLAFRRAIARAEGERFGVNVILGIGVHRIDATARMGGTVDRMGDSGLGLLVGIEPTYRLGDELRLYGEAAIMPGISGEYDAFEHTMLEVGLGWSPSPLVELAIGWRRWDLETEAVGADSDLDLSIHGPHASLRVTP